MVKGLRKCSLSVALIMIMSRVNFKMMRVRTSFSLVMIMVRVNFKMMMMVTITSSLVKGLRKCSLRVALPSSDEPWGGREG